MNHFISQPYSSLTLPPALVQPDVLPSFSLEALRSFPSVVSSSSPLAQTLLNPSSSTSDIVAAVDSSRTAVGEWYERRSTAFEALLGTMEYWQKGKAVETVLQMVMGEGGGIGKTVDDLCGMVLCVFPFPLPPPVVLMKERPSSAKLPQPSSLSSSAPFSPVSPPSIPRILPPQQPSTPSSPRNSPPFNRSLTPLVPPVGATSSTRIWQAH
jgi:hypothetical protein